MTAGTGGVIDPVYSVARMKGALFVPSIMGVVPPLACSTWAAQAAGLRAWPMLFHGCGQTSPGCCVLQSISGPLCQACTRQTA